VATQNAYDMSAGVDLHDPVIVQKPGLAGLKRRITVHTDDNYLVRNEYILEPVFSLNDRHAREAGGSGASGEAYD
jgi:hypothetical protein